MTFTCARLGTIAFAGLFACLTALPAGAGLEDAQEFSSRYYEITTDVPKEEAKEIARHMDAIYAEYSDRMRQFKVKDAKPVRLYLWADRETYLKFLARKGVDGRTTGGLFFAGGGEAGLTTWVNGRSRSRMYHTLQHEGFHQFAHLRVGRTLPPWANEGVAEYFGHALLVDGKMLTGQVPSLRLKNFRKEVEEGNSFPLGELLRMDSEKWNKILMSGDPRAQTMYTQAWLTTHFLIHAENGKYSRAFEKYLELLSKGHSNTQAFEAAFGSANTEAFQRRFIEFLDEVETDPLSEARVRLTFLAEGILALRDKGVEVESYEQLTQQLREHEFSVTRQAHGVKQKLSSEDATLFEPPEPERRHREAEIEFIPSKDPEIPPTIAITGLRTRVAIEWITDPDGGLSHRLVFE